MAKLNAYEKHYGQLKGKTVASLVKTSNDDDAMYGLMFTDGTVAWIQMDPEGNGPGFLEIELPKKGGN